MKPQIIFIVLLILYVKTIQTYGQSGVYTTWQDYKSGKVSLSCKCDSPTCKIKLHDFASRKYLDLYINKAKYRLCKDSIFGYRDCNLDDYRFYKEHDAEYKILESKNLTLYVCYIGISSSGGKNYKLVPNYFFSAIISSDILPLTLMNLKKVFPDNIKFHNLLDITFENNGSLIDFDVQNNMYKLNYLLNKSLYINHE